MTDYAEIKRQTLQARAHVKEELAKVKEMFLRETGRLNRVAQSLEDVLHSVEAAIDQANPPQDSPNSRCEHGVWLADRCYKCTPDETCNTRDEP